MPSEQEAGMRAMTRGEWIWLAVTVICLALGLLLLTWALA